MLNCRILPRPQQARSAALKRAIEMLKLGSEGKLLSFQTMKSKRYYPPLREAQA